VGPEDLNSFHWVMVSAVTIGIVTTILFHWIVKVPCQYDQLENPEQEFGTLSSWFKQVKFYQVNIFLGTHHLP
jgi:uncharacterized membrane protein YedE/YeeE